MYTNIPHDLGETAIRFWFGKCREKVKFTDIFISEGLKLILQRNVFDFDGKFYHQKTGTAMGTKVAPTYATLVMGYLEVKLYERLNIKYGPDLSEYERMSETNGGDSWTIVLSCGITRFQQKHFGQN